MSPALARWLCLLALALAPLAAVAQDTVIYKCTDAAGNVTFQNDVACPPGARQEEKPVDVPPALPAYVPREARMPDVVAAEQARLAERIERVVPAPVPPGERKPPPPLYQCTTWEGKQYLTGKATPQTRCAPLQVVGIAGTTPPAAACERVADTCEPVADEALCRAWKRRVDEAEFRWKFSGGGSDADERFDYELLRATFVNSRCNQKP
ncbi:MAG TPA: DUF4124 domain-containing protein [Luteimonas sp.]|nr:DUF4124 domain-containing protein [Luteimonas sp.]